MQIFLKAKNKQNKLNSEKPFSYIYTFKGIKYHTYSIRYYRIETEHTDYINKFNDKVKSNIVLYL